MIVRVRKERLAAIFWLCVLAIFARAVLPSGYMIAPDAAGALRIVPCTGSGPVVAPAHRFSHEAPAGDRSGFAPAIVDQPCTFGVSLCLGVLPHPAMVSLLVIGMAMLLLRPNRVATGSLRLLAPPPPSRGPPAFV